MDQNADGTSDENAADESFDGLNAFAGSFDTPGDVYAVPTPHLPTELCHAGHVLRSPPSILSSALRRSIKTPCR